MGICQTCGGVNGPSAAEIVSRINTGTPNPWACVCSGHDKPEPKHDGKLDAKGEVVVRHAYGKYVEIEEMQSKAIWVTLNAEQALSLLSWLQQEQSTLEKMVGVEKDTSKE